MVSVPLVSRISMPDVESVNCCDTSNKPFLLCKIISAISVVVLAVIIACMVDSYHKINEGNVGIYFKYGALKDDITYPGVHFLQPFVVDYVEVKIRPQTDTLDPIKAITKDGIQNSFNGIQVISRIKVDQLVPMVKKYGLDFKESLIFDRIREALKIYCANNTIDDVYNKRFLEIVQSISKLLFYSIINVST